MHVIVMTTLFLLIFNITFLDTTDNVFDIKETHQGLNMTRNEKSVFGDSDYRAIQPQKMAGGLKVHI